MKFDGKILVIGLGGVSRCTLPLLFKHHDTPKKNYTVMDFANVEADARWVKDQGANFVKDKIERANFGETLSKYVGKGDLIVDLAWNIGCDDMLQWCHDHDVMYANTSVELWDPYENKESARPADRTLYVRHMAMRKMMAARK